MSMFMRNRRRRIPGINSSSLPDLIFTVLFFFMIVTNMRQDQLKVDHHMPQSRQLERVTNKQGLMYIHIGRPATGQASDAGLTPRDTVSTAHDAAAGMVIQINDSYVTVDDIGRIVNEERARMKPEDARAMRVIIKADRHTPMGLVNDVKQALRQSDVLNIVYAADQKDMRR